MSSAHESGSVTTLVESLKGGDREAATALWRRYYPRMVALARKKLRSAPRRVADENDAALSAFDSFCRRAEQGQFPDLTGRDALWALLVVLTARKVADLIKHAGRQKRGGQHAAEIDLGSTASADHPAGIGGVACGEPTPEEAAILAEEVQTLLARLPDANLRAVAVWKLEGFTNAEIADRLGCSGPTVERRLALIRRLLNPA